MTFNALIIDDEQAARQQIESLLKGYRDFRVVGQADRVDDALHLISQCHPNVLFLDIDMPGKDGFEVVKHIGDLPDRPAIVFVTAYGQFAIRAIKESALDYLLKPVDPEEFERCIQRIRNSKSQNQPHQSLTRLIERLEQPIKVGFNNRAGTIFLDPEEIIYCKADGNYTEIHLGNSRFEVVTMNLGNVSKTLPQAFFIRLGRSYILNMKYLEKIVRADCKVVLQKGGESHELKLSRKSLRQLEEAVSL
jgi:DNA-binding LytR/AlgR family response regulator